jgi:hypothetical protein
LEPRRQSVAEKVDISPIYGSGCANRTWAKVILEAQLAPKSGFWAKYYQGSATLLRGGGKMGIIAIISIVLNDKRVFKGKLISDANMLT